ncbi:MAG: diguanylate cyclase [Gammaproteobacteria bacterium]|nr:diguanylate cyclase [Gammaproteobacteria bacterium]
MSNVFPKENLSILIDALDSMQEALVVYGNDGCLLTCNQAFLDMYGYSAKEAAPGTHFKALGIIDIRRGNVVVEDEEGEDYLQRKASYRKYLKGSFTVKLQDGRWIRTTDRPMPGGSFVSVHVDITELKEAQQKISAAESLARQHKRELAKLNQSLEYQVVERTRELEEAKLIAEQQARTDPLTRFNNRRAFFESAAIIHESARRFRHPYSIMMIDIDYFKNVNDTHGHLVGDRVIQELSHSIAKTIRRSDIAGRFGGDEFAAILPETPALDVKVLAERLRHSCLDNTLLVDGNKIPFSVSIGIGEHQSSDTSIDQVMSRADDALYQAKQKGRDCVVVSGSTTPRSG